MTLTEKLTFDDISWSKKFGVACALKNPEGTAIWLSKRLGSHETGKYACPGGMVDPGESFIMSIQREIEEETGLKISTDRFSMIRSFIHGHIGQKSDYTVWYHVTLTSDEIPRNMEPEKHGDWCLCPINVARVLPLMFGTSDVLDELFSNG
jgi:8-oxo-dGTP diphosphatase